MKARFTIPAKTTDGDATFPLELEREGVGELQVRLGGETVVVPLYRVQQALSGLDFYTEIDAMATPPGAPSLFTP